MTTYVHKGVHPIHNLPYCIYARPGLAGDIILMGTAPLYHLLVETVDIEPTPIEEKAKGDKSGSREKLSQGKDSFMREVIKLNT